MYIIVGLGNPERKYAGTRHNIGFSAITAISDAYGISMDIKKHKAVCGKGMIAGNKVLLAMPQTYMNLSGVAVGAYANFFNVDPQDIAVVQDDLDLPTGQVRVRRKGSAGGHNGIKSVQEHLGTGEFPRFKIGIGHPAHNNKAVIKHVLQHGIDRKSVV